MTGTKTAKPTTDAIFTPARAGALQRKCACGGDAKGAATCPKCQDEEKKKGGPLQRSATRDGDVGAVPPIVHGVLRSPGQPLDREPRAFMEPRFGADFSGVRIPTDSPAAEASR